jgi:hypothetical protein
MAGVAIRAGRHSYAIEINEQIDRVPRTEAEMAKLRREHERYPWLSRGEPSPLKSAPNERLELTLPSRRDGSRSRWSDARGTRLEDRLLGVFIEIERRTVLDDRLAEERRARETERQERERLAAQHRREVQLERARAELLTAQVKAWEHAVCTRRFTSTLRRSPAALEVADAVSAWCDWADHHADSIDPVHHPTRIASEVSRLDTSGDPFL